MGWKIARLKDVADEIFVGVQPAKRKPPPGETQEHVTVSVGDIRQGTVAPLGDLSTTALRLDPHEVRRYGIAAGDILLSAKGTQLKIARVFPESTGAVATATLIVVRPGPRLLAPVLFAFLSSPPTMASILALGRRSVATTAWSMKDISALPVPVPPPPVQQAMKELIDTGEQYFRVAVEAATLRRDLVRTVVMDAFHSNGVPPTPEEPAP
jgi:hypothetical protein